MRPHLLTTAALMIAVLFVCAAPARAQPTGSDKDQQIAELTKRVAELERRLAELETLAGPLIEQARSQQRRDSAKAKARARMRQDHGKYSREVLSEVEQLYQTANKNWRSPGAVAALEKLVNEYPDLNRTGCAVLYLGQMTQGAEKADHLTRAMTEFPDCYYGDGVNVGAYAALHLASHYHQNGQHDQAEALFDMLRNDHPDAVNHNGGSLIDAIAELETAQPVKADGEAEEQ